jgi:hypothetical protein
MSPVRRERTSPGKPTFDPADPRGRQAGGRRPQLAARRRRGRTHDLSPHLWFCQVINEASWHLDSQPPSRSRPRRSHVVPVLVRCPV